MSTMTTFVPVRAGLARVFALSMLIAAVGCAHQSRTGQFTSEPPPEFSASGDVQVPDRWWGAFDDSRLNQQIDQAFNGSFTLAAALQRLNAARAVARREASDLWPDLDGVAGISSGFGPGEDRSEFTWGFDASYQVDLWGEIQSRVDAERLRASATREDYYAVALTLTGEIVRTWFSLIEAHAQAALIEEQIETNRNGLRAQELRFGLAGLVQSPDVLRQRQLVESTLEQRAIVKARIEILEHQMAVLLGSMPQQASYYTGSILPDLPPLPDTGLPCDLLQRRPDVRRDYLAFLAADRDLASAISDQFPRLSLTGSVVNIAERPETLFRDWFVGLGAQLIGPIVDGGQRRAEVHRSTAVVRQRFNEYGATMLNAFREVEDALALERNQLQRLKHLDAQLDLARKSSDRLREYYLIGDANYLDVLSAIQAQQRLQRETLTARLELLLIRVSLYLALAGDFQPRPQDNIELIENVESIQLPAATADRTPAETQDASSGAEAESLSPLLNEPDLDNVPRPQDAPDFQQLLRSVERVLEVEVDE